MSSRTSEYPAGPRVVRDHGPLVNRVRRVLMDKFRLGEDQAYHALRRLAMNYRLTRDQLAARLLDGRTPWQAAVNPAVAKEHAPPPEGDDGDRRRTTG